MIPCRIFLQKYQIIPQQLNPKKLKIVLTLNSIYYDQIQPFKTKYFCLSTQDVIGVQVTTEENDLIVGNSTINLPYKLAIESETVQLTFKMPTHFKQNFTEIKLCFLFEPVMQFSKKKLGVSTKNINLASSLNGAKQKARLETSANNTKTNNHNDDSFNNNLEISFSHRDALLQTSQNFPRDLFGTTTGGNATGQIFSNRENTMLLKDSYQTQQIQGSDSLQSLALQRQKILGELFGKLKRDNKRQ